MNLTTLTDVTHIIKKPTHLGQEGTLFNPFRVDILDDAYHGFHPRLFTFNPYRGYFFVPSIFYMRDIGTLILFFN